MKYIMIPSYRRLTNVLNLIKNFRNSEYILLFCLTDYCSDDINKIVSAAVDNNVTMTYTLRIKPGIGNTRLQLLKFLVKVVEDSNDVDPEVFMQDDDVIFSIEDIDVLCQTKKMHPEHPIYAFDFSNFCYKNGRTSPYITTMYTFVIQHIDYESIKFAIHFLTKNLEYFEDFEFNHLIACYKGVKGLTISKDFITTKIDETKFVLDSVIDNKTDKKLLSIKLLKERYGSENIEVKFNNKNTNNLSDRIYIVFKNGAMPKYR